MEPRFFLPILPLACFYLWRGATALGYVAKVKPRALGGVWLPVGLLLAAGAWGWVRGYRFISRAANSSWEDEFSLAIWALSVIVAGRLALAGKAWLEPASGFVHWVSRRSNGLPKALIPRALPGLGIAAALTLVVIGVMMQTQLGRENRDRNALPNRVSPDMAAAQWIQSHTDPDTVIMARFVPTASHYSKRRVIWFPPSSNPMLLQEGIRKHGADFLIVVRREGWPYYFPPDEDCFAPLVASYPDRFRLVYQTSEFRIFQVVKGEKASPHLH